MTDVVCWLFDSPAHELLKVDATGCIVYNQGVRELMHIFGNFVEGKVKKNEIE